jgi:hypothetical protein
LEEDTRLRNRIEKTLLRIPGIQEASATDSDKSEPSLMELLIKKFDDLQHTLQTMTQGLREMIWSKKSAQKAHARRERRGAARQKEVGNQPLFPVDCPQKTPTVEDYGNKAEAGTQPPIEDWTPPEIETAGQNGPIEAGDSERSRATAVSILEGNLGKPATTQPGQPLTPQEVGIMRRDAKRTVRATKGIAHAMLRSTQDQTRAQKPKPEKKNTKLYVTLNDRVGLPFLKHWDAKRRELHVGIERPWDVRKYLTRVYRLKGLRWVLYRKDLEGGRWVELRKLLKIAEEGDEYQLEIYKRRKRHPNAPGSSRRQHFDRPNSRKNRRDFIWSAPAPRYNSENQVRLTIAGQTGFEEAIPQIEIEERRRMREYMQIHKEELLKDDRIKPTVILPMQEGARESHEEGCSPNLQKEESDSESDEPPPPPAVTPEAQQAIRTLEIIAAERARLDERDERRRLRHEEIQAKIHRPPVREETIENPVVVKMKKKPSEKAAKSKAKKSEDGKAKQLKAEQRTKKGKK